MMRLVLAVLAVVALASAAPAAKAQDIFRPIPASLAEKAPVEVLGAFEQAVSFRNVGGLASLATGEQATPIYTVGVPRAVRNAGDVSVRIRSDQPVAAGDVLLVRMSVRALKARQESGEAEMAITYQEAQAPHERSLVTQFSFGLDWTVLEIPFTAAKAMRAGESELVLGLGGLEQTVELTGVEVLNFQSRATMAELPATRFTYLGREAGGAWREAALARIEEIRTAPLAVRVVGADGAPIPGAKVTAELIRPEFLWGTAVNVRALRDPSADGERYRSELTTLFDTATIDNALKWPEWAREETRPETLAALDWLNDRGMRVRGHNLIWPAWKFSPRALRDNPNVATELKGQTDARVRSAVQEVGDRVFAWDVVNEPMHEKDFFAHMPLIETVAGWFKIARETNPDVQLAINDYAMLNRSSSPIVIAEYTAMIAELRRAGAPIDVVGVQGHVGQQPRAPELVLADLDLFRPTGLPVQITEFDINTKDEALQADYTRDFLIAIYSHPVVNGYVQWGFWEKAHWKPDAAMFRADWSERPALQVWRDLVLTRWRTRVAAATAADGRLQVRGHLGRYKVTATRDGRTVVEEVGLTGAGAAVDLVLP